MSVRQDMENRLEELRQAELEREALKREREERDKRRADNIEKYKQTVITTLITALITLSLSWLAKQILP